MRKNNQKNNKKRNSRDSRFEIDARFIPVDGRAVVKDKSRFGEMFDASFPMLASNANSSAINLTKKAQQEHSMKNLLKQTYKTKETAQDKRVKELLKEQERLDGEGDEEDEEEEDDEETTADMRSQLFGGEDDDDDEEESGEAKDDEEEDDDEEEEEDEERQISFDEFLENLRNRPDFMAGAEDEDDVMDFVNPDDEEDEYEDEEGVEGEYDDEEESAELDDGKKDDADVWTAEDEKLSNNLMRSTLWKKHLELIEEQAKANTIADGEETHRLAVSNCDWSIINSTDLFVMFKTLCPTFGDIKAVTIYLSNFGKEMLEKEEKYGPQNIWLTSKEYEEKKRRERELVEMDMEKRKDRLITSADIRKAARSNKKKRRPEAVIEDTRDTTDTLNPEKVREYEFNKMKYYFAEVICDSKETANHLYEHCEGQEIESTAIQLDLRFIPDEVTFEDRTILNQCTIVPGDYKPKQNVQSKPLNSTEVHLTWEAPDIERNILLQKNFNNVSAADFQKFIGSDSESDSDSDDEEVKAAKKKQKKLRKQKKKIEDLKDKLEDMNDGDTKDEKMEKLLQLESKLDKRIKKQEKKIKKTANKDKRKKYKDLLKMAKMQSNKNMDYDASQNLEITFDTDMEEKQKELANIAKEKQLLENETWWETLERKRREKQKDKKKQRKEEIKGKQTDDSESNSENEEDVDSGIDEDDFDGDFDADLLKKEQQKRKQKDGNENKKRQQLELLMSDYKANEAFNIKRDHAREVTRRVLGDAASKEGEDRAKAALSDPRFKGDLVHDPEMGLDPTHPKYKKSQLSNLAAEERRKARLEEQIQKEKAAKQELKKQQQAKRKSSQINSVDASSAKRPRK